MAEYRHQAEDDDDKAIDEALENVDLWIKITAVVMPRVGQLELAEHLLAAVQHEYGGKAGFPSSGLLGVQFVYPQWIVYCSTLGAKIKLLNVRDFSIGGRSLQLEDFKVRGFRSKDIRLSIHGIPHHIKDREVEQWISQFVRIATGVKKHKLRTQGSSFQQLFSGHRFCYAQEIISSVPRYSTYPIPDPVNPDKLIDIDIVVYHDNQIVNCKFCKDYHPSEECPKRQNRRRQNRMQPIQALQQLHLQAADELTPPPQQHDLTTDEPPSDTGADQDVDHKSDGEITDTDEEAEDDKNDNETTEPTDKSAAAVALAEDMIDHAMGNKLNNSEELGHRYDSLLAASTPVSSASRTVETVEKATPAGQNVKERDKRKDVTPPEREKPEKQERRHSPQQVEKAPD